MTGIELARPWPGGNKKGWGMLDAFTASAIVAVADALGPDNLGKFNRMPLVVQAKLAFRLINRQYPPAAQEVPHA